MGATLTHLCTHFAYPTLADTAIGRRKLMNGTRYDSYTQQESSKVKITTEYVENANGELLFIKLFEPRDTTKVKAMILHSIGFCDNTDWLPHDIGIEYAKLGFIVFMFDHKGHGKSDGLFADITDFHKDIVDQTMWIFNYGINKYIKTNTIYNDTICMNNNYFLSGHSMGAANTICVALKQQQIETKTLNINIRGIIVIAPMVEINKEKIPSKFTIWLLKKTLLPYCPKLKIAGDGLGRVTKNEDLQRLCDCDPIQYGQKISLITGHSLITATQYVQSNAIKLQIPMFICHGDDDIVTDCLCSKSFYDHYGCNNGDKMIKLYKGKGHILWKEEPSMYNDTVQWMMKYIQQ